MQRIISIDVARGLAIIFALTSHALSQFGNDIGALEASTFWIKLLTRSATPMFFILFGVMLNLVYLRKARMAETRRDTAVRLVARALICYVLYVAITVAAVVSGKSGFTNLLKSLVLAEGGRFGMILAAYAVLFGIVLITLPVGTRFGSMFYFAIAAAAWTGKLVLDAAGVGPIAGIQPLVGHGVGFGPAILLSFTFVAYGVLVGEAWEQRRGWRLPLVIAIACAFGVVLHLVSSGVTATSTALVFEYRWSNHPAYFAYGIVVTSLIMALAYLATRNGAVPIGGNMIAKMGRKTLFAYALGNILLNLLPITSGPQGAVYLVAFLAFMILVTTHKDRATMVANRLTGGMVSGIAAAYRRLSAALSDMVVTLLSPLILPRTRGVAS